MKIMIRDCKSGDFLVDENTWTQDTGRAKIFPSSRDALDFCLGHPHSSAEVVLMSNDGKYESRIPFGPECMEDSSKAR